MERSRQSRFAEKLSTKIWRETPSADNPYLADRHLCRGYDLEALTLTRDVTDVLYLLIKGELPEPGPKDLLRRYSVAFCSPGPRHPAVRAVMNSAASGTQVQHLLPIGLSLLGGEFLGSTDVGAACRYLGHNLRKSADDAARSALDAYGNPSPDDAVITVVPGFGSYYRDLDPWAQTLARSMLTSPGAGQALQWGEALASALRKDGYGWLPTGLAAAISLDLGLNWRAAVLLYHLVCAPGILAHGLEMAGKSITDLPFLSEADFEPEGGLAS